MRGTKKGLLFVQGRGMALGLLGDLGRHGLLEHSAGPIPECLLNPEQQGTRGFRAGLMCGSHIPVA